MNKPAPRSFVDYYLENDISPVHQDIQDLKKHFERRASLYRLLGIAPTTVYGRRVLEFGPGSGHNALYTASLRPSEYVLVDANPRGVADTRSMLVPSYAPSTVIQVVQSFAEDFRSDEPFNLVLAENLIPFQQTPSAFVRTIASFVSKQGLLVITCIDGVSHLSEIGRRLIAGKIASPSLSIAQRLAKLRPVFAAHLGTLSAMSRSVDDWILDNITHPIVGTTFSIPNALEALSPEFDIFGSSPSFVVDWRWYKELFGDQRRFNKRMENAYYANVINFLDCRHVLAPHDPDIGQEIASVCEDIFAAMRIIERSDSRDHNAVITLLDRLATLVRPLAANTAESIDELTEILAGSPNTQTRHQSKFEGFFGRGTQYLSFLRH